MTNIEKIYEKNPADVAAYITYSDELIANCDKFLNAEESPIAVKAAEECIKAAQSVKYADCPYNAYRQALAAETWFNTAERNYWG